MPAIYQHAWRFSEGLAAVVIDNKLGFINVKGETVIPFKFYCFLSGDEVVNYQFQGDLSIATDSLSKHGLIDKKGNWILTPIYDCINDPKKGYRVVELKNKYGLLNSELKLTLPIKYDNINIENDGFVISKDGSEELISFDTKKIIQPLLYDEIVPLQYSSGQKNNDGEDNMLNTDYFSYRVSNNWGVMNKDGKVITKAKYESITAISTNLFSCGVADAYVIVNSKGEEVH